MVQSLVHSGSLNAKGLERVRARDRRRGRDYSMSDWNPLVSELNWQVEDSAVNGA